MSSPIGFGFKQEWQFFINEHALFLKKLEHFYETSSKIFIREFLTTCEADGVVFYLGRLCLEDFNEILLLCANGYGFGGMKILRGLFERAVLAAYVAKHPDCAEAFMEYDHIYLGETVNGLKDTVDLGRLFSPDKIKEIEESYEKVEHKFQAPLCEKCGTTQTQHSWSKLSLASMAARVGMGELYLQCYFDPTMQTHASVSAITLRMKEDKDGAIIFDSEPQRGKAKLVLMNAHILMVHVLDTQNRYFDLKLDKDVEERNKDFTAVWG